MIFAFIMICTYRMMANQDAPSEEVAEDDVEMEADDELDKEKTEKQLSKDLNVHVVCRFVLLQYNFVLM